MEERAPHGILSAVVNGAKRRRIFDKERVYEREKASEKALKPGNSLAL